ncbi:unnamed protein product [Allacma fusca]|uniref:Uncharacterized protein n=1 Tax=Allacma fusca TaxID=39272 RepID=A0A8J2JCG5_9HEXA|nr:unnamed protein product [Allacma fusca]
MCSPGQQCVISGLQIPNFPGCLNCQIPMENTPGCRGPRCGCFCPCRPPTGRACYSLPEPKCFVPPPYCRPSCISSAPPPAIRCTCCRILPSCCQCSSCCCPRI